jgi:hypothetical protein
MIRTQIQLTPEQLSELKQVAARQGRSVAELVREGVDAVLQAQASPAANARERAAAASGRFRSGVHDLARRHDAHLAEAFSR